jgi:hypothetical protein
MAILVDNTGLPYYVSDSVIEEPSSSGIIFDNLKSLSVSLSLLTNITRTNLGNVQSTIQNTNPCFNVFAVVSHQLNSESLVGVGTASGKVIFTKENFAYNTSSANRLSTGKTIVDMSGGINYSLPEIDGKKWMACAIYDGSTNGFRGILLWVFLNQTITTAGTVSATGSITRTSEIFYPSTFGLNTFRRVYQVVIGPSGGLSASNVSGNAGWVFSSSQNAGSAGYNAVSRFSADDGVWAMVVGGKNNGESVGFTPTPTYKTTNGYGFGNFNSSDFSSNLYWNGVNISSTNYVGFVFTGDA